jgi:hypothetical protein
LTLTFGQWLTLRDHLRQDLSYGEGGTWNREQAGGQWGWDQRGSDAAERLIDRLDMQAKAQVLKKVNDAL